MVAENGVVGSDIVRAAVADLEGFFLDDADFRLPWKVGNRHGYRGRGTDAYLVFDAFMLDAPVADFESLAPVLIILGHEAAHFLLRHNDRRAPEQESLADKHSLEMWADSFGTKLALTLLTYGAATAATAKPLLTGVSLAQRLETIGRAIGRLGMSYFDTGSTAHPNSTAHPDALTRVGMCATGVTSFLDVELGSRVLARSAWAMQCL